MYRFGRFTLDTRDERLLGPDGPVKLGNKAYRVLLGLIEQPGLLITKDRLFETVWDGTVVSESALTSVIKELRRALGDDARAPAFIESAYGRGYRFIGSVSGSAEQAEMPAISSPRRAPAAVDPGRPPLLMVPPIDDRALGGDQPHLASILHEELLLALSRFQEVRLVSEREGGGAAVPQSAPRDYRLVITLFGGGEAARAFVRLSRLATGEIVWADSAPLGAGGLGQDVERLVRRISGVTLPRLYDDVLKSLPAEPQDIYDRYYAYQLRMRAHSSGAEAVALAADWERLIAEQPGFGPAYLPLIRLYNTDFCFSALGATSSRERRRASELARVAIDLEPRASHFQVAKGWCDLWDGDAAQACAHFEETLALNPYHQSRLIVVATGLIFLDELDRAAQLLDEQQRLSPFAAELPHEEYGLLHLVREDYAAAAEHAERARRSHPDDGGRVAPTVMSELYALLAAAGLGRADTGAKLDRWRRSMAASWSRSDPPGDEELRRWARFHNPFQSARHQRLLDDLLSRAFEKGAAEPRGAFLPRQV